MRNFNMDDIFQDENGAYYFWDEIGESKYGPYPTREKAEEVLEDYCKWLDSFEAK